MSDIRPGWYILNYHNVSWEENPYNFPHGTHTPDMFEAQVKWFSEHGKLVSIEDGERQIKSRIDEPLFSFWFDDGLAGVRRYAQPIMDAFGVSGAISVCSRFTLRQELFFKSQLSFIAHLDGLRILRSKLRPLGFQYKKSRVSEFLMDNFNVDLRQMVEEVYQNMTRPEDRTDAFRIYDTVEGLKQLRDSGWTIANHTAAHYPVGTKLELFQQQFEECEEWLTSLGWNSNYWVLPFDHARADELLAEFRRCGGTRKFVLVGQRVNQAGQAPDVLHRVWFPVCRPSEMANYLAKSLI